MKHYDDLQRFKDKTRTGAINFKDMAAQTQTADSGRWAIIKQLNQNPDDENAISHVGSVPAPQSVKADEFDIRHAKPASTPVVAPPAVGQSIIIASVASSVASTPVEQAMPEPAIRPQPAVLRLFDELASAPAPAIQPRMTASAPPPPPRQQAEALLFFNKLFSAKAAPTKTHTGKYLPLQPLLEMIASCH